MTYVVGFVRCETCGFMSAVVGRVDGFRMRASRCDRCRKKTELPLGYWPGSVWPEAEILARYNDARADIGLGYDQGDEGCH